MILLEINAFTNRHLLFSAGGAQQTINMGVNLMDTVMLGGIGEVPFPVHLWPTSFSFIFNAVFGYT